MMKTCSSKHAGSTWSQAMAKLFEENLEFLWPGGPLLFWKAESRRTKPGSREIPLESELFRFVWKFATGTQPTKLYRNHCHCLSSHGFAHWRMRALWIVDSNIRIEFQVWFCGEPAPTQHRSEVLDVYRVPSVLDRCYNLNFFWLLSDHSNRLSNFNIKVSFQPLYSGWLEPWQYKAHRHRQHRHMFPDLRSRVASMLWLPICW